MLVLPALFVSTAASAQSTTPAAQEKDGFHGWEIEGHIGTVGEKQPTGTGFSPRRGLASRPRQGAGGRLVPSWYFGNGAVLANQVAAAITANGPAAGPYPLISPLDPVLTSAGATMRSGRMLGFRAGHSITHWVLVEFMFDRRKRRPQITGAALAQIEASRASFEDFFHRLTTTAGAIYTNPHWSSTATIANSSNIQEYSAGLAFNLAPVTISGFTPYFSFGGELVLPIGDGPEFEMAGHYGFNQTGAQPGSKIDETDTVRVRYKFDPLPVKFVGLGVQRYIGRHGGFRADVHVELNATQLTTRIDTQPVSSSFAASKNTGTVDVAIQFSATPTRPSSLAVFGELPVNRFDSLVGKASATSVSVGYFLHF